MVVFWRSTANRDQRATTSSTSGNLKIEGYPDLFYLRHRDKMASLTAFQIIIAQETGPWPRLAGIGEGGGPERVLLVVGLSAYKTRVAVFPLQVSMRIALQSARRG